MYTTGEKPGAGTYTCTNCGQKVRLDDDTDRLPPCPNCMETNYHKGWKNALNYFAKSKLGVNI